MRVYTHLMSERLNEITKNHYVCMQDTEEEYPQNIRQKKKNKHE